MCSCKLALSPFTMALLVSKWLFHASGNAGCPQRKQTEGTYRGLLVPLNNRTVYQWNKHFLLWNKKTTKREKRQLCHDTKAINTMIPEIHLKKGGIIRLVSIQVSRFEAFKRQDKHPCFMDSTTGLYCTHNNHILENHKSKYVAGGQHKCSFWWSFFNNPLIRTATS